MFFHSFVCMETYFFNKMDKSSLKNLKNFQTPHNNGTLLSSSSADISEESVLRRPARPLSFAYEDVTALPNGTSIIRNGHINNGSCTENNG